MRFGLKLASFVGALVGALPSPAAAADGAGLFALPPSRLDAADGAGVPTSEPPAMSGGTFVDRMARAMMAVLSPPPSELRLAPLVGRGGGGGLRLVLPVCEDGCSRYASRAVFLVAQSAPDSPFAWLAAVTNRGGRSSPEGPPGLAAVREEARRARAKVPQEEASALPE